MKSVTIRFQLPDFDRKSIAIMEKIFADTTEELGMYKPSVAEWPVLHNDRKVGVVKVKEKKGNDSKDLRSKSAQET